MKNIKQTMAAVMMMVVLMAGTAFAKGAIILSDASGNPNVCTEQTTKNGGIIINDGTGIIINGLTGIIINGLTGIIINGLNEGGNCGVSTTDRN